MEHVRQALPFDIGETPIGVISDQHVGWFAPIGHHDRPVFGSPFSPGQVLVELAAGIVVCVIGGEAP